jgi:molecular chaperone Hsp33
MIHNRLLPFAFDNHVAHGAIVNLHLGVEDFLGRRRYSADVARLVGEAMAAMPLLTTHMHFEGRINLQFQGSGPIKLLVAQIDHHLNVRGMAKVEEALSGGFTELLQGGILALMLEPSGDARAASQATVPIEGASLAEALQGYFAQSEQLPTLIRLAARGERLAGFKLQRLPLQNAQGTDADWEHLQILADTLQADELLDTEPVTVLRRLFAEEPVRVFAERPVQVACRCSRDGISRLLLSLGREEIDGILAEQGRVAVTCEFCGHEYTFNRHEAGELFEAARAAATPPLNETRH